MTLMAPVFFFTLALPLSALAQDTLNAQQLWTAFDLPTRGAEPRYISVHEAGGQTQVVLPYFRARKIAVMTLH